MWPLAVLCLALGVAGSVAQFQPAQLFAGDRNYIYQYDTQIVNGIPTAAKQYSILKMRAQVMVIPNGREIQLQMLKVEFWSLNGNPGYQYDPTNSLVDDMFLFRVVGPEIEQFERDLKLPFEVPIGEPAEITVNKDDPYWSVNIKRGIVALLTLQDPKELEIFKLKEVTEMSPVGLCNTSYMLTDKFTEPSLGGEWLKMTKVRDYQSCVKSPIWYKSSINGKLCKDCAKKDVVTPSFHVTYTLRQTDESLELTGAVGEGKVQVTPYSNQFEGALVSVNQTISLIKKMKRNKVKLNPLPDQQADIFIFYPELVTDPLTTIPENHLLSLDERLLDLAAQNTINIHTEEGWMRGKSFIDMLRTYNAGSIEQLADKYMKPDSPHKNITMAKTILNYLAIAGTWNTSRILLDKCDLYFPNKCPVVISLLGLTAQARPELTDYIMQNSIPKNGNSKNKIVKLLLLGTLGGKMKENNEKKTKTIQKELALLNLKLQQTNSRLLRKKIKALIASTKEILNKEVTEDPHEKIIKYIMNADVSWVDKSRALGNAGWDKMELLTKKGGKDAYFPGDALNRTQAILSLHKTAVHKPHHVIAALTPVAKNTSEVSLVRNAAYWILFKASLNRTMLEYIAKSMRTEPNTHVAAFVLNYFYTIANSSSPCEQSLRKNVSTILHLLPRVEPNLELSQYKRRQFFNDYLKIGGSLNFGTISTNESSIPDAAALVLNGHAFGYDGNLFEVAYNSRYIQRVIDNLFGPKGNLTLRKSLFDIFARKSRSAENPVQDIMEAMKIITRSLPEPQMIGVVKMFDNVMNVFHMTHYLREYINNGLMPSIFDTKKWREGVSLDTVTNYGLGDVKLTVPLEAGFPVDARLTAHVSINVTGKASFKVLPETDGIRSKAPQKFQFHLQAHPQGLVGMLGSVSANLGPFQTGVSTRMQAKVQAPIDLGLEVKLDGEKLYYFFLKPPINKDGVPFMQLETAPSTFLRILPERAAAFHPKPLPRMERTASEILDIVDIDLTDRSVFSQRNRKFGVNGLGMTVEWSGQIAKKTNVRAPPCPFSGKNSLTLFLNKGKDVPSEFSLAVKCMAEPAHAARTKFGNSSECDSFLSYWTGCLLEDNDLDDVDIAPTPSAPNTFPDFVNLRQHPYITLEQIRRKLQTKTQVALPYQGFRWGAIVVLNASSEAVSRGAQLELYWRSFNLSTSQDFQARLVRTALPNGKPKYEATMATKVKYPIRKLSPEQLLNATYQREQHKFLQRKFDFDLHATKRTKVNNTLYALAAKTQHAPKLEPDQLIDSVLGDILLMSGDKFSMEIRLLLQQLVPLRQQVLAFHDKSKDIMIVRRNLDLISSLVNRTLQLQKNLTKALPLLPALRPYDPLVAATLEMLTLRDLDTVIVLKKIVDQTRVLPIDVDIFIYPNMKAAYKAAMELAVKVIDLISDKEPKAVHIKIHMEKKDRLCPFIKDQLLVIKKLVADVAANRTIDAEPIFRLVKQLDDDSEKKMAYWIDHDVADEKHVMVISQITVQHLLIKLLFKYGQDALKPFNKEKVNPFLELRLQQQSGIAATVTALAYKQWSDVKVLVPMLNTAEVTLLKEVMHPREKMQASQFFRIAYLISDLKNATQDPAILRELYSQVKAVAKNMTLTHKMLDKEILALLDPSIPSVKVVLVYKVIRGLVSLKENANYLRHIRTSFPQPDRKDLYLEVESLLWQTEILRGNLSLVFDKLLKPTTKLPADFKFNPDLAITSHTVIKLPNQSPLTVEMEAVKTIEQVMFEYQQLDPRVRQPSIAKYFRDTLGSQGNLTTWDSLPFKLLNDFNHIHTTVKADQSFVTPRKWKSPLMRAMNYLQFQLYNFSSFALPLAPAPNVRLESVLELDLFREAFDLYIETKNFSRQFFNVPTSPKNPLYTPVRNTYKARWQIMKMLTANHLPARCSMANRSVSTFDDVVYQVPLGSDQRLVAAMDCSYLKSFAVISHMSNVTNGSKILEVYTDQPRLKVVVYPDLVVFVNDKPVDIIPSIDPFIVNSTVFYNKQVISMKIAEYRGVLLIEFPLIGLNIFFDGNMFTLEGSMIMRSKMCGLCSNFDGFKAMEFEGPKFEQFDSPERLVTAYTVPEHVPRFSPPSVIGVIDQFDQNASQKKLTSTMLPKIAIKPKDKFSTTPPPVIEQAEYHYPDKKPSTTSKTQTNPKAQMKYRPSTSTTTTTSYPPSEHKMIPKPNTTTTTTTRFPPAEKKKKFTTTTPYSLIDSTTAPLSLWGFFDYFKTKTTTTTTSVPLPQKFDPYNLEGDKKKTTTTTTTSTTTTTTTTTPRPPPLAGQEILSTTTPSPSINACEPKPRTSIFKPALKRGIICFSKIEVQGCQPQICKAKSKGKKIKLPFTCMKENAQTQIWEQKLISGAADVISDIKNLKTSRTRRVNIIPECMVKN